MTQRYIDLAFDDAVSRSFGGFDNENEATMIRLKVLNPDAQYYLEIERVCAKHDKYCSETLPVADGYATFEIPRDFTHETLYVQGVMKADGVCRKTARVRVGFGRSINALDELPESHPSWADSVDERIDNLGTVLKDAVTYTPQELTDEQQTQARANINAEKAGTAYTKAEIDEMNEYTGALIDGLSTEVDNLDKAVGQRYTKPDGGIPKTDLAEDVQTSLDKADNALQSVPDTYRTAAAQDAIDATKQTKAIADAGGYFGDKPTVEIALQQLGKALTLRTWAE